MSKPRMISDDHQRIIAALERWREREQEVLATVDPASPVDQILIIGAQDTINQITRILEGEE